MSGECAHVIVVDGACVDCQVQVDAPADAEKWFAKAGTCVQCKREVKNGVSRGKGVACVACWWRAIGGGAG